MLIAGTHSLVGAKLCAVPKGPMIETKEIDADVRKSHLWDDQVGTSNL